METGYQTTFPYYEHFSVVPKVIANLESPYTEFWITLDVSAF